MNEKVKNLLEKLAENHSLSPEEYEYLSSYGIEIVPYILRYVSEYPNPPYHDPNYISEMTFFMTVVYEMLGVKHKIDWVDNGKYGYVMHDYALALQDYLDNNGLKPIYPLQSARSAEQRIDCIRYHVQYSDFNWHLNNDIYYYQSQADRIMILGPYAVPYILDYILSHEGQPLTPDEELNLGVLLHLCYRMLGVESTAEWHMPAEAVESTTDPFLYARELAAHLDEYELGPVE